MDKFKNPNALICVFCEGIVAEKIDYTKTQFCVDCHDYKGLTTVADYLMQYGTRELVTAWKY